VRLRLAILVVCLAIPALLPAETIILKNGKRIVVDTAHEKNGRVEYAIGEDTYAIPKSLVDRIDDGGTPSRPSHTADIPEFTPNNRVAGSDELASNVLRSGRLDTDALHQAEASGDTTKAAGAYFLAARFEQDHGNREQAVGYYQRALAFLPDNVAVLSHLAAVLIQMERPSEAIPYAERALRADPNSVDCLTVLGVAYFAADRSRDAIPVLKRALAVRPNSSIQKLLDKAEREVATEAEYQQRETGHFTLRYEGRHVSDSLGREILATLESHYDDLVRDLGVTPRASITVIVYTDQAFEDVTQSPQWTAAVNDGKLRIPIEGVTSVTPSLSRVLRHELAHSFISQASSGRCPQWLHEGIAQLVEPRRLDGTGRILSDIYAQQKQVPLNALEGSFMAYSGQQAIVAYAESLAAAEYINETYGMSDLRLILERIGQGASTEAALRQTIHSGYEQLESDLGRYLKERYGN
jgi:tetratricopeptide (TPR) repeat protein